MSKRKPQVVYVIMEDVFFKNAQVAFIDETTARRFCDLANESTQRAGFSYSYRVQRVELRKEI